MDTFHAVKSSRSLVFNKTDVLKKFAKLRKKQKQPHEGVLKIYSKFTGEHPCRSVISIKLQSNFIESHFSMSVLL